jgi:hypothetical protein
MSTLRQAVQRASLSIKPSGIETAAAVLKRNAQTLRNELAGGERHKLDITEAELIIDLANSDELANAAARQRGGLFVRKAYVHGDDDLSDLAILEIMAKVWSANGEVGRVVDEVLADRRVEKSEVPRVREAVIRWQQSLDAMLRKIEALAE